MCISYFASFQILGNKYAAISKADGPLILKFHVNQKYWNLVKVELIKLYANIQQKLDLVPNSINTQLEFSTARFAQAIINIFFKASTGLSMGARWKLLFNLTLLRWNIIQSPLLCAGALSLNSDKDRYEILTLYSIILRR